MKNETLKPRRIKLIAAVCAVTVLADSSAGIYAFSSTNEPKTEQPEEAKEDKSSSDKDDGIISGGGTVTSSQLSDELGMKNTSVRLTVEEVLAEAGDSVTEGTELYKLTEDSLEKAKKTLDSELKSAENALTEQKTSAQADKIKARTLYESQLLLGDTAEAEYEANLSALDTKLQKAYSDYQEAQDTVNNTPCEISQKQSEVSSLEADAESLQSRTDSVRQELEATEQTYTSAAASYNALLTEYNSAASVVRYLGNALGSDTSNVSLAEEASPDIKEDETPSGDAPDTGDMPSFDGGYFGSGDFGSFDGSQFAPDTGSQTKPQTSDAGSQTKPQTGSTDTKPPQQSSGSDSKPAQQSSGSSEIKALYDQAYKEYTEQKEKLDPAEQALNTAEQEYKSVSATLSDLNSKLKETQSSITSLNKEISSLESSLLKAKSDLSKLRSEYNSLNTSYETDKLELKNKLDTDLASYENAQFHYELTCSTIDADLEEKQSAYDTAKENLSIFEEQLSDGYIRAGQEHRCELALRLLR